MMAEKSALPIEKVKELFCNEVGYQTPKLGTRAAIFKDEKILLVQENDGTWSIPGGWCKVDLSVKENVIKEIKEEADITVERLIAIYDSNKHYKGMYIRECILMELQRYFSYVNQPVAVLQKMMKQLLVDILHWIICLN